MKTPDYLSYSRYKKKKNSNPNKRILIFVTTFFATLLLFTVIAKSLSPDVDVTIGEESATETKETGLGVKKFIDERLKMIQMEDSNSGVAEKENARKTSEFSDTVFDNTNIDNEEKINIPSRQSKNEITEADTELEEPMGSSSVRAPRPRTKELSTPFNSSVRMTKVYVGRYSTLEQAKVAQDILMDAGLGITPFIKDTGNYYTLQIGSYTSRAKAEGLASELQKNNFPARIVQE